MTDDPEIVIFERDDDTHFIDFRIKKEGGDDRELSEQDLAAVNDPMLLTDEESDSSIERKASAKPKKRKKKKEKKTQPGKKVRKKRKGKSLDPDRLYEIVDRLTRPTAATKARETPSAHIRTPLPLPSTSVKLNLKLPKGRKQSLDSLANRPPSRPITVKEAVNRLSSPTKRGVPESKRVLATVDRQQIGHVQVWNRSARYSNSVRLGFENMKATVRDCSNKLDALLLSNSRNNPHPTMRPEGRLLTQHFG